MAIPTPYSYRQYTGDGVAKDFQVPFPYLERAHVHVYLNDTELTEGTDFVWTSDTEIQLTTAPQAAVTGTTPKPAEQLTVRRQTPEDDQIVQWTDGSYIIAADLNDSDLQWLYLIQEHHDWLVRLENNLGALPGGGGSTGPVSQYWNKLARHLDPDKDTANEKANVVDTEDQKTPDATGLKSGGWISDDDHIATTGALAERYDVYVQDTKPPDPPITEVRQPGKIWINDGELQIAYWEPAAKAWVQLANTGPKGDKGDKGDTGTYATIVQELPPTQRVDGTPLQDGDCWFRTSNAQLYAWYDDGTSQQWVSISKTGPKGDKGDKGDTGPAATLPVASAAILGGVKTGTGVAIAADGTISTNLPGALTYKGTKDLTAAPPAGPTQGDVYVSSTAGTINTGWTGISGGTTAVGDMVLWDGAKWDRVGSSGTGVTSVTGATPITIGGTATAPEVQITAATASAAGSMSAADKAKLDGLTPVTVASSPPATPKSGQLWFNTDKGIMYVWYADGSSNQWVSVMGSKAR